MIRVLPYMGRAQRELIWCLNCGVPMFRSLRYSARTPYMTATDPFHGTIFANKLIVQKENWSALKKKFAKLRLNVVPGAQKPTKYTIYCVKTLLLCTEHRLEFTIDVASMQLTISEQFLAPKNAFNCICIAFWSNSVRFAREMWNLANFVRHIEATPTNGIKSFLSVDSLIKFTIVGNKINDVLKTVSLLMRNSVRAW